MASPPSPPSSPPNPKRPKMSSSSNSDPDLARGAEAFGDCPAPRRRYKRRKVAILLGYCGAGYQGMQKNPGARTIEGDLEEALFLAGAVPEADRFAPRRYDWARAARTDKGVSAAAQVVSGRFYVDPPGFAGRLNSHLPDQIRVFGYTRITNSFNAKKFCDRRRYVYLLPVFALDPSAHPDREAVITSAGSGNELVKCVECSERGRKVPGIMGRERSGVNGEKKSSLGDSGDGNEACGGEFGLKSVGKSEPEASHGGFGSNSLGKSNFEACHGEFGSNGVEKSNLETCDGEFGPHNVENADICGDGVAPNLNSEMENGAVAPQDELEMGNGESMTITEDSVVVADSIVAEDEPKAEVAAREHEKTNGEEVLPGKARFSYSDEVKERFNRVLKHYVGTHNFHNFTTRTKAEDPSAKRYIISFNADRVISIDRIDFVRCEVVGQSFMLHQIRKMIGLAVAVMRSCAPESLMEVAFRKDVNINVPTAPEVGLHLDECMFTSYNQKWKDSHEAVSIEPYAEEAEEFKMKYIFTHIAAMEHKEGAVALWLHSLNHRNYPDFNYMETTGAEGNVAVGEQVRKDNLVE